MFVLSTFCLQSLMRCWVVNIFAHLHFSSVATTTSSRLQSCIQQCGEDSELWCDDAHTTDHSSESSRTGNPLVDWSYDPNGMVSFGLPMVIPVLTMLTAYDKMKICKDKLWMIRIYFFLQTCSYKSYQQNSSNYLSPL